MALPASDSTLCLAYCLAANNVLDVPLLCLVVLLDLFLISYYYNIDDEIVT